MRPLSRNLFCRALIETADVNEVPIPRLPWATVPGRLRWVSWTVWIAIALCLIPLLIGVPDGSLVFTGVGLNLFGSSLAYEAFRTGTARSRGPDISLAARPVLFSLLVCSHLSMSGLGAVVCVLEFP